MIRKLPWLGYYKLEGKLAVPCKDAMEWARWFEKADRYVAHTKVGGVQISTVFLGLDHNFNSVHGGGGDEELPLLFETMAFAGGDWAGIDCERCGTWEEAEAQHAAMVEKVRRRIKENVND